MTKKKAPKVNWKTIAAEWENKCAELDCDLGQAVDLLDQEQRKNVDLQNELYSLGEAHRSAVDQAFDREQSNLQLTNELAASAAREEKLRGELEGLHAGLSLYERVNWQEIKEALGMSAGLYIPANIIPCVNKLKADLDSANLDVEKLRGELERIRAENEKLDTEATDLSHERSHRRMAEADVKHWKDIAETQGEQLVKQQAELSRLQPFNRVLENFPPAELDLRSAVGLGNTGS